ncbi:vacuolar membrane protein-domain-containing protein [Phycomyces nitens]|nr:vacuolar membrane protein-domain-containing protein [Phycomyces nitens]
MTFMSPPNHSTPCTIPTESTIMADGSCTLLDSFAILVQLTLAATALGVLAYKRWRERPQRPVRIWALDVSKQFVGAGVIHALNLAISYLAGRPMHGPQTNLCVWYFLNTAVDTTIGVGILWFWLHLLERIANGLIISLRDSDKELKSDSLSWIQETTIFLLAEALMKICVYGLLQALPFYALGEYLLSWANDNRDQVVFVMFIFPLIMNAIQFWIIDSMLMVRTQEILPEDSHFDSFGYSAIQSCDSIGGNQRTSQGPLVVLIHSMDEHTRLLYDDCGRS